MGIDPELHEPVNAVFDEIWANRSESMENLLRWLLNQPFEAQTRLLRGKTLPEDQLEKIPIPKTDYQELWEQISESAPIGICRLDTELRYVYVNEWLAAMNGLTPAEHLGKTLCEVIPHVADEVEPILYQVMATGKSVIGATVRAATPANPDDKRTFQHNYHAIKAGDVITGVTCIVKDITNHARRGMNVGNFHHGEHEKGR